MNERDIVERLRADNGSCRCPILDRAAEEIERLREYVVVHHEHCPNCEYPMNKSYTVETLRVALQEIRDIQRNPEILTGPANVLDQLDRCRQIANNALLKLGV